MSREERLSGIHANRDVKISGQGHRVAGGNIVDVHVETMVMQQAQEPGPLGLLPPDATDFTGRNRELQRLETELLTSRGQAVAISAIYGKPGVGKSALAVHLAHKVKTHFPDGQVYVNLRGTDQEPVAPEVALTDLLHVLGVPGDQQPPTLHGKTSLWRHLLADRRILVLVDNALDEAQVRPLLPGNPLCAVIVTSRQALATCP